MSKNFSFSKTPIIKKSRTRFDLSHSHKTMFNSADLIPFYVQEIYPGDTFKVDSTNVIRTTTPFIKPVMDNLFLDMFYFFVPNRLVYSNWPAVMGENKDNYWAETDNVLVPSVYGDVKTGSIADYLGLPIGSINSSIAVNSLPFRAFALIYNEWFRDQNTQAPVLIPNTYSSLESLNGDEWSVDNIFGLPPKVNKLHDYFTSCLPAPQKGNAVDIPIDGKAYVTTGDVPDTLDGTLPGLRWQSNGNLVNTSVGNLTIRSDGNTSFSGQPVASNDKIIPANLYANLTGTNINVNDLRFAFQLQKLLEKDARGGTRYIEYLQSHFGVISPDSRLQRPEFLGGKRMPLNITQVNQTTSGTGANTLGEVGAYSLTSGKCGFNKGFVEHGFVIGVMCVRQHHTYQQGIERFWSRKQRTDYYDPVFANIGEQPVLQTELFVNENSTNDNVFGYNEAWADLRYRPSRISGPLRSQTDQGFDIWHFADDYDNAPVLGSEFITETSKYIDRTLSVPSSTAPQFIIDIYNKVSAIRELPMYSIPGLIDHH